MAKKKKKHHSAPPKKRGPSKAEREARELRKKMSAAHRDTMKVLHDISRGRHHRR